MRRYQYFVPSFFSFIRLLLAISLPVFPEHFWVLFITAAALSDFLDGWLARTWKVESWQGGLLDAVADKMFVLVTLYVFVAAGKFSPWWIFPVIVREITVAITALYTVFHKKWEAFKEMDARVSGKLATLGQFVLFLVILLFPEKTIYVLLLASCCSIAAGIDYGRLFFKALRRQSN